MHQYLDKVAFERKKLSRVAGFYSGETENINTFRPLLDPEDRPALL